MLPQSTLYVYRGSERLQGDAMVYNYIELLPPFPYSQVTCDIRHGPNMCRYDERSVNERTS
ncbi:hypothetical protein SCA6_009554 [Theobroma cacao]